VSSTPSITSNTITDNTNCSGASPNGSITIDVNGGVPAATDYTIQWYNGIGTSSAIAGETTATLSNLAAGDYTVEVTDILSPGNTCVSTATFSVIDDLPVFTINSTAITVSDQTDCVANGSAEVTDIMIDGVSNGGTTGFTFEWFDDAGVSIDGPGASAIVGVPLAAGNYRVVATNTTSLCSSAAMVFTVDDASVTPSITQNSITANTNCSGASPNGSITIDVNGGVPAATDYTIQWYSGIGTSSAIAGATTATLSNLAAGDYTVEVTDILSPGNTCVSTATFTVVDDLPVFTINSTAITVGDQTDCVANGSAEVTDIMIDGVSNGGTTGFTFEWFDDAGVSIDGPGASAIVGVPLAAGNYRVVATNTTSLCSSAAMVFAVDDASVTPSITSNTITDNTNCSGAPSNGSITIDVNGGVPAATDYTIQWYNGIGTSSAIAGETTATLSNLAAGDYTVEVTDILSPGNTCVSTATFTVVDDLPVFTINSTAITVGDQTDCVANGSAEVTDIMIDGVSNGGTTGFTFEWFDDAGVSIDGPGASAIVGVPLAAGNYRVVATNTTSLCSSAAMVFTVDDASVTPSITQNTITANTNCSGASPNGSITIDVNGGVPAATDYTIQWYNGIGTSSAIAGETTATLSNLAAGDYTVEVTDILSPGNTCVSTATFSVVDDLPVFTINSTAITVGDQIDCVANGSAEVTDIMIDGVSNGGTIGFTFEWFDDAGVSIDGPGASAIVGVPLAAGNYRVVATNTTSLCSSAAMVFTVDDVSSTPSITSNTITDNTNCSGASPNGSITIDVNGGVPAATDYT
ncbi:hypothetical protein, partial [Chryseolinea sp. H1M3-3]|uniref:beta strand repeat-containing protein n=1 Tax=Chryseolinea sp. H1M3-3 TaxID=3034144 RepID=UPI0023EC4BB8